MRGFGPGRARIPARVKARAGRHGERHCGQRVAAGGMKPMRLVLAGGGHSHAEGLGPRATMRVPGLAITLVTREAFMPYSGMLPGYVAGHYTYEDCHIELPNLAQKAGAEFCLADVDGIDLERRHLHCA